MMAPWDGKPEGALPIDAFLQLPGPQLELWVETSLGSSPYGKMLRLSSVPPLSHL